MTSLSLMESSGARQMWSFVLWHLHSFLVLIRRQSSSMVDTITVSTSTICCNSELWVHIASSSFRFDDLWAWNFSTNLWKHGVLRTRRWPRCRCLPQFVIVASKPFPLAMASRLLASALWMWIESFTRCFTHLRWRIASISTSLETTAVHLRG